MEKCGLRYWIYCCLQHFMLCINKAAVVWAKRTRREGFHYSFSSKSCMIKVQEASCCLLNFKARTENKVIFILVYLWSVLTVLPQPKQRLGLQWWRGRLLLLRDRGQHGQPNRGLVQPHTHLSHHGRASARLPSATHRCPSLWAHHHERFTEPRPDTAQSVGSLHTLPHPHRPRLPGNPWYETEFEHAHTQKTHTHELTVLNLVFCQSDATAVPLKTGQKI